MYKRDRRGRKYPVDQWGVRVWSNRDAERLYRPEEVDEGEWRKAPIEVKQHYCEIFPPRKQGTEPEGEPEKVKRAKALEQDRADKRAKRDRKAAVATVGVGNLFVNEPGGCYFVRLL